MDNTIQFFLVMKKANQGSEIINYMEKVGGKR